MLLVALAAVLVPTLRNRSGPVDGDTLAVIAGVGNATRERGTFRLEHTRVARFLAADRDAADQDLRYEVRREATVDLNSEIADVKMLIIWPGWPSDPQVPPCRFISTTDAIYYEVPAEHRGYFDGRHWLPSDDPISGIGRVDFAGRVDPIAGLGWLEDAREWRHAGRTEHRGTPVTRFRGVVPAPTPPPDDDGSRIPGETTLEVWIDDDGLLRRVEADQEVTGQTVLVTHDVMEFIDYGEPSAVAEPSPDTVFTGEVANATQVCMGVHPDEAR